MQHSLTDTIELLQVWYFTGEVKYYYLLCAALPEDKQLRYKLKQESLQRALKVQQREREDNSKSWRCLFCIEKFDGNRFVMVKQLQYVQQAGLSPKFLACERRSVGKKPLICFHAVNWKLCRADLRCNNFWLEFLAYPPPLETGLDHRIWWMSLPTKCFLFVQTTTVAEKQLLFIG